MSPALRPRRRLPHRLPQAALRPPLVSPVTPLRVAVGVAHFRDLPVSPRTLRHLEPTTIGYCRMPSTLPRPPSILELVSNTGIPTVVSISCSFTLTLGSRSAFVSAIQFSLSKVSKLYRWYTSKPTTKGEEEDKIRQPRITRIRTKKGKIKTFNLFKMFLSLMREKIWIGQ